MGKIVNKWKSTSMCKVHAKLNAKNRHGALFKKLQRIITAGQAKVTHHTYFET